MTLRERAYDAAIDQEVAQFTRYLAEFWPYPGLVIASVRKVGPQVWASEETQVDASVRFAGSVWIGAGRAWKRARPCWGLRCCGMPPAATPPSSRCRLRKSSSPPRCPVSPNDSALNPFQRLGKRGFDIAFALSPCS